MKFHIVRREDNNGMGRFDTEPTSLFQRVMAKYLSKHRHKKWSPCRSFDTKELALQHIKRLHTGTYKDVKSIKEE